jgi:hypothetical protein
MTRIIIIDIVLQKHIRNKTFAEKKDLYNSTGMKRVVQEKANKHILNSPHKTTSKAIKIVSFDTRNKRKKRRNNVKILNHIVRLKPNEQTVKKYNGSRFV